MTCFKPSLSLVIKTEGRVVLNLPDRITLYCGLSIFASLPVFKQHGSDKKPKFSWKNSVDHLKYQK